MSARSVWSVGARVECLAFGLATLMGLLATGCGQKGPLIAVKAAASAPPAASASMRAPLPPPEPLEPPIPGTSPR